MFSFDYITKEDIKKHNANWPQIPDHPYRILIVGGSGSCETNALLNNVISHQQDTDKIYLYLKDLYDTKYQLLIHKREGAAKKHFNDSEAFINTRVMLMIFIKILKYTIQLKKQKILIAFDDDVIADVLCNKELNPIKIELLIRGLLFLLCNFILLYRKIL